MYTDSDLVAETLAKAGFQLAPLRNISRIAGAFRDEAEKIQNSKDYTPTGKVNALARLRAKAQKELDPFRAKVADVKVRVEAKRAKAEDGWGGQVDPDDVREMRQLIRGLDPLDVQGRLHSAAASKDVAFIRAVESTLGTEFPLATEEEFEKIRSAMRSDKLDDDTQKELDDADAADVMIHSVVGELDR